ncbi:MAG: hypothetical protein FJX45_18085 [Alphaproteobacteria bacterium]|nr:hypothetical protein [Alphaproteobacteria bacterium]MBM3653817.1 hypothetical protein [Alphaproteobacteria bacterium]
MVEFIIYRAKSGAEIRARVLKNGERYRGGAVRAEPFFEQRAGLDVGPRVLKNGERYRGGAVRAEPFFEQRAGLDVGPFYGGAAFLLPPGAFRLTDARRGRKP